MGDAALPAPAASVALPAPAASVAAPVPAASTTIPVFSSALALLHDNVHAASQVASAAAPATGPPTPPAVASLSPVPATPPQISPTDSLSPVAAASSADPSSTAPAAASPAPPAGQAAGVPGEKPSDVVLSPGEVDLQLSKEKEEEHEGDTLEFLVSVSDPPQEKHSELYAGLTRRIQKFIRYFQTRGRDRFEVYLSRSGKYGDMMKGILAEYGLPRDLIYLALIESGFSPKAYSTARAAGPWQFITGTARRYGLRVDWWTDERRDYEKSTHAAARYLGDLYGMFDSWPLAAAAYNAGERKIQKAMLRYRSEDYVELIRHRYLAQETKDYVPKMIAALSIAKEPDKYGFGDVKYEEPIEFEKLVVPGGTALDSMGRIVGIPYETLREWNPELRRFCTPPTQETYELRLPKGYASIATDRMDDIRKEAGVTFLSHSVKKGESLDSLARRYQTSPQVLKELNGLKRNSIGRTKRMIIPVTGLSAEEAVPGKEISAAQVEQAMKRQDDVARHARTIRVRKGDTLSSISRRTGVSVQDLAAANGIGTKGRLKAGARLRIPRGGESAEPKAEAAGGGKKEVRHVVRKGETLSQIAAAYGVTPERLTERNRLKQGQSLPRGRVLFIPTES